jgi:hypothetical protein
MSAFLTIRADVKISKPFKYLFYRDIVKLARSLLIVQRSTPTNATDGLDAYLVSLRPVPACFPEIAEKAPLRNGEDVARRATGEA